MMPVFALSPLPILFLVFSALVIFLSRKPISHWLGSPAFKPHSILLVLVALLVIGVGVDQLAQVVNANDTQHVNAVAESLAMIPMAGIAFLILSAFAEEVFFRGIIYRFIGGIGSAFVFAAFHLGYQSSVELAGALLAGLVLAWAREKYGSIYPGVGGHLLYNLAAVFVLGNL